jgi:hypothetical protein
MFAQAFKKTSSSFPSTAYLLPLISKLGEFLKKGFEHYAQLAVAGTFLTPEALSNFLYIQMASWNPKIKNTSVLDETTKKALARFLAGVAIKIHTGEK